MKVAMGMQKQITAKRGQIDALQSKIQFLEEAMTNANKVSPCPWRGGGRCVHSLVNDSTEKDTRGCGVQWGQGRRLFLTE